MSGHIPAIVIVAFNRPESLRRLLSSVGSANYPAGNIPLCFCIDYQDTAANKEVVQIAEAYDWPFGPKEIIRQSKNLGLKAHVLASGDLTERFGSIIMLEDDLYVSPGFYAYTVQALEFYNLDKRIGGISLYNHRMNFSNRVPFNPVEDGSDVYFLQIASSWGQAWSKEQWSGFREWISENPVVTAKAKIPRQVINWPEKSWLKHYISYLAQTGRYFVYPRISLTTNFGDSGENNAMSNFFFQVPILHTAKEFTLQSLNNALAKYDAFFDLLPEVLIQQNKELASYKFVNNLSGLKSTSSLDSEWVLIFGANAGAVKSYGLSMKPIESNILHVVPGEDISLVSVKELAKTTTGFFERKRMYDYKYGIITPKEKIQNVVDILITKIRK